MLIVDDHAIFRSAARRLLEGEGFEVVGEASDGETGLSLAHELAPQLVLLDVALPDRSGYEVARRLAGGASKVVLVSSRSQDDVDQRFRESGALGFIPKERLSGAAILDLVHSS